MHRQRGLSFWGFMFVAILVAFVFLLGAKVTPSVIEYFAIKKAITIIAKENQGASVSDIRKAFDRRAQIDDFTSIAAQDLDITKDAGEVVISVSYKKQIPLAGPVSLLIDYQASSSGRKAVAPE